MTIEEAREILAKLDRESTSLFGEYLEAEGFISGWKDRGEKDIEITKKSINIGLGRTATKVLVAALAEIQKLDEETPSGSQEEGKE